MASSSRKVAALVVLVAAVLAPSSTMGQDNRCRLPCEEHCRNGVAFPTFVCTTEVPFGCYDQCVREYVPTCVAACKACHAACDTIAPVCFPNVCEVLEAECYTSCDGVLATCQASCTGPDSGEDCSAGCTLFDNFCRISCDVRSAICSPDPGCNDRRNLCYSGC